MEQQNEEQKELNGVENRSNEPSESPSGGSESAGSQASTTGYGTGQSEGHGTNAGNQAQQTPSNSGNAGVQPGEGGTVSEARTVQMSHADGSKTEDDPDV